MDEQPTYTSSTIINQSPATSPAKSHEMLLGNISWMSLTNNQYYNFLYSIKGIYFDNEVRV